MVSTRVLTRQKLVELARSLPPAPRVFAELNTLLKDPNTALDRIADLIKRDAALAASIIRVSNSAAFNSEQKSGSIEEAVTRVGFGEVYRIVGFVAVQRLADQALLYYDVSAERLRDQMLETAYICEALADRCQLDPRSAYTAGLMRPIGILILDRVAQLLDVNEGYHHEKDQTYSRWEGLNFGMASTEVAGVVLGEWDFPADIISAIRDQYLTHEEARADRLATLLNVASAVIAADGRALEGEERFWSVSETKLAALGLSERDFTHASERATKAFDAFRAERGHFQRRAPVIEPAPAPGRLATAVPFVAPCVTDPVARPAAADLAPPVVASTAAPATAAVEVAIPREGFFEKLRDVTDTFVNWCRADPRELVATPSDRHEDAREMSLLFLLWTGRVADLPRFDNYFFAADRRGRIII
jgi:HD-like signal output (HDOD) protein